MREAARRHREKYPDRVKAAQKKHDDANREKRREAHREWKRKNPEKAKQATNTWRKNNRAHVRKTANSWHQKTQYGKYSEVFELTQQIFKTIKRKYPDKWQLRKFRMDYRKTNKII